MRKSRKIKPKKCICGCGQTIKKPSVMYINGERIIQKYIHNHYQKIYVKTPFKKGLHISPKTEFKKGLIPWNKGKRTGIRPWNYKGGITPLYKSIWCSSKYQEWRKSIFKRDNFSCCLCKKKSEKDLNAHHKKRFVQIIKENNIKNLDDAYNCQELWDINNGVTYCEKCHITKIHHKKSTSRLN